VVYNQYFVVPFSRRVLIACIPSELLITRLDVELPVAVFNYVNR
jgi:hypothetical protein